MKRSDPCENFLISHRKFVPPSQLGNNAGYTNRRATTVPQLKIRNTVIPIINRHFFVHFGFGLASPSTATAAISISQTVTIDQQFIIGAGICITKVNQNQKLDRYY
mmetsp:Transcript_8326/g.10858  ORF Transcript_8326/g.10858 Transcript_8326/m.10858 type:complete len:106 (-) Transcript_8326:113-430(-)